jgi:hypothetical protein
MMSLTDALLKARNELNFAIYMTETAPNAGLRKIYSNKAEFLSTLIYATNIYKKLLECNTYG